MDRELTDLYMKFLMEELRNILPQKGCGKICYTAHLSHADDVSEMRSVISVAGFGPRSLSFRLADIIKYHREKLWDAPEYIVPECRGDEIQIVDNITIGSGAPIGSLARATAKAVSIFVEKYLLKG
ncbi:MAG: hypothetical protein IIW23_02085 [Clostridia bacterium]|nr:hypothetical protein [Clostridia bacterium]